MSVKEIEKRYMTFTKLEEDDRWKRSNNLAETIYKILDDLPEEERYLSGSKMRSGAFNITSDFAEAVGSVHPGTRGYHLSLARRDLFSLKNAYRFAARKDFISLDPKIMVELDQLIDSVDKDIAQAQKDVNYLEEHQQ